MQDAYTWSPTLSISDLLCVFIGTFIWDFSFMGGFVAPQQAVIITTLDPGWHPFLPCQILSLTT